MKAPYLVVLQHHDVPSEAYLYLMRQTYGTGQVLVVDGGALLV
jgi:hypothetical protein